MNSVPLSSRRPLLALLVSLCLCGSSRAFELDITGISAHIRPGYQQYGKGLYLDPRGVYVANPGLAVKNSVAEYSGNWFGVRLLWQTGGMIECQLMPMVFIGPLLRLSLHLSRYLALDLNLSISLMATLNWQGVGTSGSLQPFVYPALRYRGASGTGASLNLALTPQNTELISTSGSNLLFLFLSLIKDPAPTEPVDVAWIGFSGEESKTWKKRLGKSTRTVAEYASIEQFLEHPQPGSAPRLAILPSHLAPDQPQAPEQMQIPANGAGQRLPVLYIAPEPALQGSSNR